jgi:Flp pilus assembly protein TadD
VRAHFATVVALLSVGVLSGCATGAVRRGTPSSQAMSAQGVMIEGTDQRLAAAILAERVRPNAHSSLQVAREYVRLGILDAAYKWAERALERDPHLPDAHEVAAQIWRDWGIAETALVHAHRAVFYAPRSASAFNTLGTVLHELGRSDEARAAFTKAIALDPAAGWALSNLCYVEFTAGNFDEAKRQCEAAIRASPALAAAHNNLGLTHAAAGDLAGAKDAFLGAGNAAAAYYNVGIVELAEGRYAEAAAAFQQAIDARPTFTAAKTRAHEARIRALRAQVKKQP